MKKVTLKDIEWKPTNNYWQGRTAAVKTIAIHWWDDPKKKPTLGGVVGWFQQPKSQVSAHFVVSGDRVVQMVNMGNTAWHVANHNHYTVGIEVDPRMPGNTTETVKALIAFIRTYYPGIPYKGHNQFSGHGSNRCPGTVLAALKAKPKTDWQKKYKATKATLDKVKKQLVTLQNRLKDMVTAEDLHKAQETARKAQKALDEANKEIDKLEAEKQEADKVGNWFVRWIGSLFNKSKE